MARYDITLMPGVRTSIAGAGSGGGTYSSARNEFQKVQDTPTRVAITANHLAYEGGFVVFYDESPYDPKFVASQTNLLSITRREEDG